MTEDTCQDPVFFMDTSYSNTGYFYKYVVIDNTLKTFHSPVLTEDAA